MKFGTGLIAALAIFVADNARAQDAAPAPPPVRTNKADLPFMREVDWLKKPSPYEVFSAWPKKAKTSGSASITCVVTLVGALRECEVVEEKPPGSGFGGAALSVAPQFLMKPATEEGRPIEAKVTIPFVFPCDGVCGNSDNMRTVLRGLLWNEAPTVQDVAAAYPKRALRDGLSGVASLQCEVSTALTLIHCTSMGEEPSGRGFSIAARNLAGKFKTPLNPPANGKMVRAVVRLRFTFTPQAGDAPVVSSPPWRLYPEEAEIWSHLPSADGTTSMRCKVIAGGELTGCRVTAESTPGAGAALVALAPKFRAASWTDDGVPVIGGAVDVAVVHGKPRTAPQSSRPQSSRP